MSWAFLPHHVDWAKATPEERKACANVETRLERLAQGRTEYVEDPLVYDRIARILEAPGRSKIRKPSAA